LVRGHRVFIKALELDIQDARAIVEDSYWDLWTEGDTLFYTDAGDKLFSVAIAGGTSSLVLDGGQPDPTRSFHHLLDADYFYFSYEAPGGGISFWRMPRAGGPATKLGEASELSRVALGANGLVVAGSGGASQVIPFDGSPPRPLAAVQNASGIGVDAAGAYWNQFHLNGANEWSTIVRAPVSGGPLEPFWTTKRDRVIPIRIWPDLQGGWVVTASETLDDDQDHFEIWLLDADQTGRLAAFDPGSHPGWSDVKPALAPDAVYVVVDYSDLHTWTLVRVPR
jgi:hypothetical protein